MLLSDEHDANVGSSERYTPSDLQEVLLKFGPDHFSQQGANPLRYLQVLLLSGQFERVSIMVIVHELSFIIHARPLRIFMIKMNFIVRQCILQLLWLIMALFVWQTKRPRMSAQSVSRWICIDIDLLNDVS
jgi:hypothetical protein